ncbi:MAG: ATP-binding cassette domain-containing protein [Clostridium fessum]
MSLNHERVQPILRVDGLNVELKIRNKQKKLVENVSFEVEPGQCLGILGESGSGKSMTVKAILGLLDRQFRIEGQAWFEGKDLCRAGRDELRRLRGQKIGMVLQNPMTCFDPLYRIEARWPRPLQPIQIGIGQRSGRFPWKYWKK